MSSRKRLKSGKWSFPILGFAMAASSTLHADTPFDWEKAKQALAEVRKSPESANRFVEEAKLLFYMGRASDNSDDKEKFLTQGETMAEKAKDADQKNPGALFWWSANHGLLISLHKNLACLTQIKVIEKLLLDVKALDPKYEHGGPDRALASIYAAAPPVISIGSPRKAKESFLSAIRQDPNYPGNYVMYAEFLMNRGDCLEAKKLAHAALDSPDLQLYPYEAPEWTRLATRVIEKSAGRGCTQ